MKKVKQYFIALLAGTLFSISNVYAAAAPSSGDYVTDITESWIDLGPAMEPLNFSSFLVCVISKTGASLIVNGTYNALINTSKCQTGSSSSKPEFAKVTVITSRADNSSPQTVKVWFDMGSAQAGQYLAEATMTEGVSSTAPYGSFTFSWENANDATANGTMSFTSGSTSSTVKMYSVDARGASWINGAVNNDKTTGQVAVGTGGATYAVSFDSSNVNVQKGSNAAECSDRTALTEYVHGYNIYDHATGAKKVLSGPFQCTYTSTDASTKQCYIGPYGAWYEGGTADAATTTVTHENGTVYTGITYDPNDDGSGGGTANDGVYITVPNYTFSPPVIFPKAAQSGGVQTAMGNNSFLEYFGEGSLYGLPWTCSDDGVTYVANTGNACDNAISWRPAAALTNGTVITDDGNTEYVVKAKWSAKVMTASPGSCGSLGLTDVSTTYPALTTADVTAVTIAWLDKPTVTGAPTVIDGVKQ